MLLPGERDKIEARMIDRYRDCDHVTLEDLVTQYRRYGYGYRSIRSILLDAGVFPRRGISDYDANRTCKTPERWAANQMGTWT